MCRHVPNAQFSFQAACCRRWFDCSECHFELARDHRLAPAESGEMALACKRCGSPFRKDLSAMGAEDERCPHCGNALVVAKGATAQPKRLDASQPQNRGDKATAT